MRKISPIFLIAIAALSLPWAHRPEALASGGSVTKAARVTHASTSGCQTPPVLAPFVPADIVASNSQANVNCLVWQEFLGLNWQASILNCEADLTATPSSFGQPNNDAPVVWETFKEAHEVFQKGAATPSPWCSDQLPPVGLLFADWGTPPSSHRYKVFSLTPTMPGHQGFSSFVQAGTNGAWLTAQNGNRTLYEVRLNSDEFNYIQSNRLYDASTQQAFVQSAGIDLPDGTARFWQYGHVGSIEIKAAWVELPDPSKWRYFKISKAYIVDPARPNRPRLATVGLVGLHIIHKTAKGPQFVWATFEHVNNAPSAADIQSKNLLPWYTYYDERCNPTSDRYRCTANARPAFADPGRLAYPSQSKNRYAAPMQVVRENPINDSSFDNIAGLNEWIWNLIRSSNPDSVFLNYQLVDVLWASSPVKVAPGARIPLTAGNPQPSPATQKVANTTMETYSQNSKTCLDCHVRAAIAPARGPNQYASDYSFLFSMADTAGSPKTDRSREMTAIQKRKIFAETRK